MNLFEDIGEQTKPAVGNHTLVAYGVQNEASDFRAHVAYKAMRTYVFPTSSARALISQAEHLGLQLKSPTTGNIVTAQGYPVPLSYIDGLQEVVIPPDIWTKFRIAQEMLTSTKGALATSIVVAMLKKDMIPLPVRLDLADSTALQVSGTDILINASLRLQVKCDLPGGDKRYGGTGNLFIQIAECNPYQRY